MLLPCSLHSPLSKDPGTSHHHPSLGVPLPSVPPHPALAACTISSYHALHEDTKITPSCRVHCVAAQFLDTLNKGRDYQGTLHPVIVSLDRRISRGAYRCRSSCCSIRSQRGFISSGNPESWRLVQFIQETATTTQLIRLSPSLLPQHPKSFQQLPQPHLRTVGSCRVDHCTRWPNTLR